MDHEKFARCVKEARTAKGLTQKELAERLHISDKAVSKWERMLSFPDIELLGPLSKELDVPLSVLLNVEELSETVRDARGQGFETLLAELLALMKERVQEEFYRKKRTLRILTVILTILIILMAAAAVWTAYTSRQRTRAYEESIHVFSEDDIEIVSAKEKEGAVFLDLRIKDDAAFHYGVLERHWYDKDDPTTACVQFYCYEKEYLSFDSMETYDDYRAYNGGRDPEVRKLYIETGTQQYKQDQVDGYWGFVSGAAIKNDLLGRDSDIPVLKIVYLDSENGPDHPGFVLWEKSVDR